MATACLFTVGASVARGTVAVNVISPAAGQVVTDSHLPIDLTASGVAPGDLGLVCHVDAGDPIPCAAGQPAFASQLANGTHKLTVSAWDLSNVSDRTSVTRAFTVNDTSAPTVSFTTPTPGSTFTGPMLAMFIATGAGKVECAVDGSAYSDCEIFQDGEPTTAIYRPAPGSLVNGAHALHVRATDPAGNASTTSLPFSIADSTPPTVAILDPVDGATVGESPLALQYDTDHFSNGIKCRVDVGAWFDCADFAGFTKPLALSNGSRTIDVQATDAVGLTAVDSVTVTIDDSTAPVVTIDEPSPAAVLTDNVIGSFSVDQSAQAECSFDGGTFGPCVPGGEVTWLPGPGSDVFNFAAANGPRTATVRATDAAGNSGQATVAFTMNDTTAPAFDLLAPAQGATVESPFFAVPVGDTNAVCEFRLDGGAFAPCDGGPPSLNTITAGPGSHTLEVRMTDGAGNASTVSRTVTVPSPPTPPNDPPPPPAPGTNRTKLGGVFDKIKNSPRPKGFKLKIGGRLVTLEGAPACPSSVKLVVSLGRKSIVKSTVLTTSTAAGCRFQKQLVIARKYGRKKVTVSVSGGGPGTSIEPFTFSTKLKLQKAR